MKRFHYLGLIIFVVFFLSGCVTTLKNYKPKNADEAQIKDLLIQWEQTWNNGDVPGHLAPWNDNAKIMYGKDRKIVTKKEYTTILPERMRAIPSISLGSPIIKITGNIADVDVNMSIGSHQSTVTYHLIKEKNSWSILSWNY